MSYLTDLQNKLKQGLTNPMTAEGTTDATGSFTKQMAIGGKALDNLGKTLSEDSKSTGLISAGSFSGSSAGANDLLKAQLGVGFVSVDPMRFLKTF